MEEKANSVKRETKKSNFHFLGNRRSALLINQSEEGREKQNKIFMVLFCVGKNFVKEEPPRRSRAAGFFEGG
jgi:hypothetical protein